MKGSLQKLLAVGASCPSFSIASAGSLGVGLTILTYNDLSQNVDSTSSAILIGGNLSHDESESACHRLGEELWGGKFEPSLKSGLGNQIYLGLVSHDQKFHVGDVASPADTMAPSKAEKNRSGGPSGCQVLDALGNSSQANCLDKLPALCTQSAPLSNATFEDTSPQWQVTQETPSYSVTGYRDALVFKFRGIRFAEPPLRFEYSVPSALNGSNISAIDQGNDCLQPAAEVLESFEDCLFLNIWTPHLPHSQSSNDKKDTISKKGHKGPKKEKKNLRPVVVFFYGGGLLIGSGKNPRNDQTNFASRGDVVAVGVNYRLAQAGWLPFNDGVHMGNYGLGDAIASLRWIRDNIEFFGGDPDQVSIRGPSGGADLVRALLASPVARGLHHKAIMESAALSTVEMYEPWAKYLNVQEMYELATVPVLRESGCLGADDELECLRGVHPDKLATLHVAFSYNHLDIPILTGGARDEWAVNINISDIPEGVSLEYLAPVAQEQYGLNLTPILEHRDLFDVEGSPSREQILNLTCRVGTLALYKCLERATAYAVAANEVFPALYEYSFNRTFNPPEFTNTTCKPPVTELRPNGDPDMEYYKCHGGEQLFIFGNLARMGLPDRDGKDTAFSQLVMDYWASFVRTGNPNPNPELLEIRGYLDTLDRVKGAGKWETVEKDSLEMMLLQWNGGMVGFNEVEQCSLLAMPLDYYLA